ncbi:MAG: hypothetical protein J6I49_08630 [Bacteroidales bacterium]|nr:hypothetical protein [Bacteroidales bacterium]
MKQHLPLLALLALLAAGCSVYHPQAVNIPLVNHRGDAQVDVSAGLSSWILPDVFTVNATGSYGFTDWLAGQAHLNYGFDNAYGQLAAGAYHGFGSHGVVEGYLGLGFGGAWRDGVTNRLDDEEDGAVEVKRYDYSGHYLTPFVQGNVGWRDVGKVHFDFAFGLKVGAYLPDFDYRAYDSDGRLLDSRSKPYSTTNLLVEPQVQLRIGGERAKWNLRLGFAWLNDVYDADVSFTYDWFTLSTGLTFFF